MPNHHLTAAEIRDFRALAGMVIPASDTYRVPGADDELIFNDILNSLERDHDDIRRALAHLAALAGGAFADLDPQRRIEVAAAFRDASGGARRRAGRLVATRSGSRAPADVSSG
jgi:hypothetical protein